MRTPQRRNWLRNGLAPLVVLALITLIRTPAAAGGAGGPTFQAALSPSYRSLVPPTLFLVDQRQPVGGVYLFGAFSQAGGTVRYGLARFDATGALDPAFVPAKEL